MRRTTLLLASMALVLVLASGAAFAVLSFESGGSIQRVVIARGGSLSPSTSTSYVSIPGASIGVFVPSGTSRLIMARYSAESACYGGSGDQWCSIRIVARNNATGAITELQPAAEGADLDFAFDSNDGGDESRTSWEGHSMDRSARLGAGSYTIRAERAVSSSAVTFDLDDWSFTVEQAT
jgi:hypothetical protein